MYGGRANYTRRYLLKLHNTHGNDQANAWIRLPVYYAGQFKGEMFLIVVDACSKWLEVHLMKLTTSSATIKKLMQVFSTHSLPRTIVSYNGTNFTSSEFEQFMAQNSIKHIKATPFHPVSNGQAVRAVRTFKEGFEKMEGGGVKSRLARFLFRYRTTPHLTTGVLPAEMLMRHLRTKLDLLRPSVAERVYERQSKQKATHDHHAKERDIQVDDNVYVRDFRTNKAWLPGEVIEKTGPVSTQVALEDGQVVRRHQDHVRAQEVKEAEPVATPMSAITVSTQICQK